MQIKCTPRLLGQTSDRDMKDMSAANKMSVSAEQWTQVAVEVISRGMSRFRANIDQVESQGCDLKNKKTGCSGGQSHLRRRRGASSMRQSFLMPEWVSHRWTRLGQPGRHRPSGCCKPSGSRRDILALVGPRRREGEN